MIKQGSETTQYLEQVISRLAFMGGIFLATLAFFPFLMGNLLQFNLFKNLTSLIILVGVITDGDLRRQLLKSQDISKVKAIEIMTKSPKIIEKTLLATEALAIMKRNKISQLIVAEKNNYIGVLHIQSLIKEGIIDGSLSSFKKKIRK